MAVALLRRQNLLAGQISKLPVMLQQKLNDGTTTSSNKFVDHALGMLQKHWETFCGNHEVLLNMEGVENTDYFLQDQYSTTETLYLSGIGILEALRPREPPPAAPDVKVEIRRDTLPPLPSVSLPEFSGSYLEWEAFRDAFQGLVLNRDDVPDVQKLLLLKRALKGEAALLVRNIATTAANFHGAWDAICARYKNVRLLVSAHLSALFSLPQVRRGSARDMRALIDRAREEIRALKQLNRPVDHWDDILVHTVTNRLDTATHREWEHHLTTLDDLRKLTNPGHEAEMPTFSQLESFFESRIRSYEMSPPKETATSPGLSKDQKPHRAHHAQASLKPMTCVFCGGQHSNFSCPSFRKKNPSERLSEVNRLQVCTNCLGVHRRRECRSNKTCRQCKQNHNTLLHEALHQPQAARPATLAASPEDSQIHNSKVSSLSVAGSTTRATVLLTTALVTVLSPSGQRVQTRALLDTGSEISIVSEDIVQSLGLPKRRSQVKIVGVGASHTATAASQVEVSFTSRLAPDVPHSTTAFVLRRLTAHVPQRAVCPLDPGLLSHIELADPDYHQDQRVGLILGADVFGSLLRHGVYPVPNTKVVAINTALGWVLSGTVNNNGSSAASALHCRLEDNLDASLRRFWELEEVPTPSSTLSPEERACEESFAATYQRNADGRFQVRLPRRSSVATGDNRNQAVRSLISLERRLSRDPPVHQSYGKFMHEYELLGHMRRADEDPAGPVWYLPHHAVVQSGPQGSKMRVVFDASRLNAQGVSLNQHLHPGPALLNDLGHVLMRWRNHQFVFCADIVKMFRQILVHPEDQDLQRIVWRRQSSEGILDFKLLTVTYGTACAPYLAIRVLQELSRLEEGRFPEGSQRLLHDSYVDDILSGANSLEEALIRRDELIQLLSCGKFELSKWSANCSELLDGVEDRPVAANVELAESTKMLGILWNPSRDEFHFQERL